MNEIDQSIACSRSIMRYYTEADPEKLKGKGHIYLFQKTLLEKIVD